MAYFSSFFSARKIFLFLCLFLGTSVYNLFQHYFKQINKSLPILLLCSMSLTALFGQGNNLEWDVLGTTGFSDGTAIFQSLTIHPNGAPYVAFSDFANGGRTTVMKYNGTSWVVVGSKGFSDGRASYQSLAIDASGTPYVAYQDIANGYRSTVMKYNGTSWVVVGSKGISERSASYLSLAIDASGTPFVAYLDSGNDFGFGTTVMKYNGTSWVAVGSKKFSDGIASDQSLAIDASGTPYVAYRDETNGDKTTVMKYNGTSWVVVGSKGFSDGIASYQSLAIDANGLLFVAYKDGSRTTVKFFKPLKMQASNPDNDAYIKVSWVIPKSCLTDKLTPYIDGVYIQILANGKPVYGEHLIDFASIKDPNNASANGFNYAVAPDQLVDIASITGEYTNSFRHQVGPDQSVTYSLKVYEFGPGTELCMTEGIPGSTTPRQIPEDFIAVDATNNPTEVRPDSIKMTWKNKSELSSAFLILRDDKVITSINQIDSVNQVFEWTDVYRFDDSTSLVNGQDYGYELHTVSDLTGETYPDATDMGNTIGINFKATDGKSGEPKNRVELTWADMSEYAEDLQIFRNELLLTTLAANATHYPDADPNFGDTTDYQIVLLKGGQRLVADMDTGFAPAVGQIKGKAITELGDYPISGAIVQALNADSSIFLLDTTDFQGIFSFENIVYNRGSSIIVSISKDDLVFENNPDTATLANDQPTKLGIVFRGEITFEALENPIIITNFSSTPNPTIDKLTLAWTYNHTLTDTTFFNLYRENILIAQFNDLNGSVYDYTDLTGKANEGYTYTLKAFRIQNGLLSETSATLTDTFPKVAKVLTLTASLETTNAVNLTWSHTSENFDGFKLYRNDIEIADLAPNIEAYRDNLGEPGTSLTYGIVAYRQVELITYSSEITETNPTILDLPTLAAPLIPTAEVVADLVKISWMVPSMLSSDFNYSGFRVSRRHQDSLNFKLIGTIYKYFVTSENQFEFIDKFGIPNKKYTYQVSTFLVGGKGIIFENSSVASGMITFPEVKPPTNLTENDPADDGSDFIHSLSWDLPNNATNYDGFIIYQGSLSDSIAVVSPNQSSYQAFARQQDIGADLTYYIRAYRQVSGQRYYSAVDSFKTTTLAMIPAPALEDPTNVTATAKLTNLVKICWEYPEYIQADFKIWRKKGNSYLVIDTATATERAYYDFDVAPGNEYSYHLQAIRGSKGSDSIYVKGYTNRFNGFHGRVYSQKNGLGTPSVDITLTSGMDTLARTITDSSGLYVLENISHPVGTELTIKATGFNTNFAETMNPLLATSAQNFSLVSGQTSYQHDFINYYEPPIFPCDTITPPIHFTAVPNYANGSVELSWTMGSENFSGFEVFRGITDGDKLVDVSKGMPFFAIDSIGAPGYSYLYTIRSYWDTDAGRVFSDKKSIIALFPVLLPVEALSAHEIKGENQVAVRWGHFLNNPDYYIITRNDEVVQRVHRDSLHTYIDSTGIPGKLYRYTVYAEKTQIGRTYLSEARTVEYTYPEVLRVNNLTATHSILAIIEDLGECEDPVKQNAFALEWEYDLTGADGFEIYRDGEFLTTMKDSTHYYDYTAVPETPHLYEVSAFIERNETQYFSRLDNETAVPFSLQEPFNLNTEVNNSLGSIKLAFEYLANQADGFYIYRANSSNPFSTRIDTILVTDKEQTIFEYIDEGKGIADLGSSFYIHGIQAFVKKDGNPIVSSINQREDFNPASSTCEYAGERFPLPVDPTGVKVTDLGENKVTNLQWQYPNDALIDDFVIETYEEYSTLNGFTLYGRQAEIVVEKELRNIAINFSRNDRSNDFIFVVRARRKINGDSFSSSSRLVRD